jgi:hypothetical protein
MRREPAETLALQALAWLAAQDGLLARFLDQSGAAPGELAASAADPRLLAAVLDFLLTEDAMVTGFCDACGFAYTDPIQARAALPGGQTPHWT